MANKKFSQFETATNTTGLEVVGTQDGNNVKVDAALLGGGGGGDYIPLSGTVEDANVSGNIKLDGEVSIDFNDVGEIRDSSGILFIRGDILILSNGFSPGFGVSLSLDSSDANFQTLLLSGLSENSRGFSADIIIDNKYDNDFAQMADIGVSLASKDFADDAAAAIGGVAINRLYHTAGVVKIRLT